MIRKSSNSSKPEIRSTEKSKRNPSIKVSLQEKKSDSPSKNIIRSSQKSYGSCNQTSIKQDKTIIALKSGENYVQGEKTSECAKSALND